jgi:hypothetical protein
VVMKECSQKQIRGNQLIQLKDQIAYLQLRNQQLKTDPKASAYDGKYIVDELKNLQDSNFSLREKLRLKNEKIKKLRYQNTLQQQKNRQNKDKLDQGMQDFRTYKQNELDKFQYQKKLEDELYRANQTILEQKKDLQFYTNQKDLLDEQLRAQIPELEAKSEQIEELKEKIFRLRQKNENWKEVVD